jgi:uncharacterized membrane protein
MNEAVIAALAAGTFALRLGGVLLGRRIPAEGAWARGLRALPGCLIVSLVTTSLTGGPREWAAGAVAALVAVATRNLPLTMAAGIVAIWALRHWF